jgi:outer membrane protein TolC
MGQSLVNESIKLALKNNFGLQIERSELENRISQVTKEKAFYIPQLDLNGSYSRKEDVADLVADSQDDQEYTAAINQELLLGGKVSLAYSTTKTAIPGEDTHFSSVGVSYTQPLLKNGLASPIFAEIKDAKFDRDIQQIVLDDVQIQLVNKVRTGFYQLVRQQKAADINKETLKISDDILNLIQKRFDLGRAPGLEVMLAQIEKNKNQQMYLLSLQDIESAKRNLQNLLGIDVEVKAINQLEEELPIPRLNDAISSALEHNKQILRIKRQIAKEKLAVDVARNQVLPQVDLFASYKLVGQGNSYGKANDLDDKECQAGLLVSYPFYNTAFTENLQQTRRDLKKLELRLKDLETEIVNLSTQLVNELNLLQERIDIYGEQLKVTKERLDLALKAFDQGLIIARFLYDARDDLFEAENVYLGVLLERTQKMSELQTLMCNGFSSQFM